MFTRKDYVPGKPVEEVRREYGLTEIIKMASNENPLGVSPKAMEAMLRELSENGYRYPESLCTELAEKMARKLRVAPEELYFDNGADGVITMLGMTFIDPGDEVVASELTFPAYENITAKMGGTLVRVPQLADGGIDLYGMRRAVTPKTKLVFICNPNNPTGKYLPGRELAAFLDAVPKSAGVVFDEAYCDYADEPDYPDSLRLLPRHDNLILLRTFSKAAGLAGLRCGYAVASRDVVAVLLKSREPFPVNRIAQAGALAALDDEEFLQRTLAVNRAGRAQYYAAFARMGLDYYKTQTNFVYATLDVPADAVFHRMLLDGVIIRPLTSMGRPYAVRITIGLPEENEKAIGSLENALREVRAENRA